MRMLSLALFTFRGAARTGDRIMQRILTCAFLIVAATSAPAAEKPKYAIHVGKAITCAGEPIVNKRAARIGRRPRNHLRRM